MINKSWFQLRLRELGKTQMGLAQVLDIDRGQVTRMLDGERRVQIDEVPLLAHYLEVEEIEILRRLGLNV
mgnify:CR=1 FL=1|jgi:plasmid maintenance system antidote protein VapI